MGLNTTGRSTDVDRPEGGLTGVQRRYKKKVPASAGVNHEGRLTGV